MVSTKIPDVDMPDVVENRSEQTSNLTKVVNKLFVNGGKTISRSKTKSMESNKVQGLIKELSKPIDDNDRENKSKESKPKTLLQLYFNTS
ncbi:hypothetical protein F8M41_013811 [Gigaspora margarita]|uniref:Uncharacterized protein n=1 Tax=Gigaspora margarita TaxID=4874 RepID=A0A8H3WWB6_GIGMA|nr:hypothetical protein F8M41_013811 [Gigaspora margarita]